jgi:hypothetical protein
MRKIRCTSCTDFFTPNRKDQKFCSKRCRNSYYNSTYQNELLPYKNLIEKSRLADAKLKILSLKEDRYYNNNELIQLNIDLNNALKIYINCNNEISRAYFGKYAIIYEEKGYKIYTI